MNRNETEDKLRAEYDLHQLQVRKLGRGRTESPDPALIRHDWTATELNQLLALPFNDLLFQAQSIHRQFFQAAEVQISTLLSIKTGACAEDCGYCSQSAHYKTQIDIERLLPLETVKTAALQAKAAGASRFCMGAAWRSPKEKDFQHILEMITAVKAIGLESCVTLGMLTPDQVSRLQAVGLDYYNHNLDTSREYYPEVISTRTYDDRLQTLEYVREAGINVCSGGIIGMGESPQDWVSLILELANLPQHPASVPINKLIKIPGTPLAEAAEVDSFDFVRIIALARITMPQSWVRLSAGRSEMSDELQALCFLAGANSIFYGDRLLTTDNPDQLHDQQLFKRLGIRAI